MTPGLWAPARRSSSVRAACMSATRSGRGMLVRAAVAAARSVQAPAWRGPAAVPPARKHLARRARLRRVKDPLGVFGDDLARDVVLEAHRPTVERDGGEPRRASPPLTVPSSARWGGPERCFESR